MHAAAGPRIAQGGKQSGHRCVGIACHTHGAAVFLPTLRNHYYPSNAMLYGERAAPTLVRTYVQRLLERMPGDPRGLELQAAMIPNGS